MEIKDSIIAIHESDLMDNQKSKLYGLLQELQEYRKNPLANMQPCWKYVRQNDINMQNEHVKSECREVDKAMTLEEVASEFWDILQGSVTGIFILKIKYGIDLNKLFADGIKKNTDREGGSYYE